MSTIKDTTRFFVIQGHNKSWVTFGEFKNYLGEVTGGTGEAGKDGEDGASAPTYQTAMFSSRRGGTSEIAVGPLDLIVTPSSTGVYHIKTGTVSGGTATLRHNTARLIIQEL